MQYCLSCDTFESFVVLNAFWTPFQSGAWICCKCATCRKKSNCNPSASGSTAIQLLMKSHPIAVSSDHRGVFGALTGPMRAPIWPCPSWIWMSRATARPFSERLYANGSDSVVWNDFLSSGRFWTQMRGGARERGRKKSKDRHSQPVWEDVQQAGYRNTDVAPGWQRDCRFMRMSETINGCKNI